MSETMYLLQVALIGSAFSWFMRHDALVIRLQVAIWTMGVAAIAWWLGISEQMDFYSNDQRWYAETVSYYARSGLPLAIEPWLGKKVPFTFVAVPLAMIGIHPILALKTVSIVCLLALTRSLLYASRSETVYEQITSLWLTACGTIGSFFSMLALRETMMMLFVYQFATSKSLITRGVSLIALYLLRPHLAAAIFVAEIVMLVWRLLRGSLNPGAAESPGLIAVGVVLGTTLFSWGAGGSSNLRSPFSGGWGIPQAIRISSNFVGLQFLTVNEETVELSVTRLIILRIVLNETLVIPVAFTIVCIFFYRHLTDRGRFTLLAFTIYISVVIGTDFNSFRQNIPFMPLMGLVVLNVIRSRTINSQSKTFEAAHPS